jgi:hypothetical protein
MYKRKENSVNVCSKTFFAYMEAKFLVAGDVASIKQIINEFTDQLPDDTQRDLPTQIIIEKYIRDEKIIDAHDYDHIFYYETTLWLKWIQETFLDKICHRTYKVKQRAAMQISQQKRKLTHNLRVSETMQLGSFATKEVLDSVRFGISPMTRATFTESYCPPLFYPLFAIQRAIYQPQTMNELRTLYSMLLIETSLHDHQKFPEPLHDYIVTAKDQRNTDTTFRGASVGLIMFNNARIEPTFNDLFTAFQSLFAGKFSTMRNAANNNNEVPDVGIPVQSTQCKDAKCTCGPGTRGSTTITCTIVVPNTLDVDSLFTMKIYSDPNYGFTTWIDTDENDPIEFVNNMKFAPIFVYGPIMYSQMRKVNLSTYPGSDHQYTRCQYAKIKGTSRKDAFKFVKSKNMFMKNPLGIAISTEPGNSLAPEITRTYMS